MPDPATDRVQASKRSQLRGLYAITPEDLLLPRLSALVAAALHGGVRLLQYRNKTAPAPLRRAQAAEMLRLCHAHNALLIVNDDLPLALEINADGVHLGRDDHGGDLAAARAALGPSKILGISCYADLERARQAAQAGADYIAFGCMYPSTTKPEASPASLTLLNQARQFDLPVAAIGGITLGNATQTIAAGADMLAVISDLFEAPDITAQARAYTHLFTS
ncbi:MAG: thiamine phosphate synthase [Sterolibacterium sp.]|nr:thiamine phosphate synthase [Sterolibacterium sp.]